MRVGLIGWATRTGIGQMNQDLVASGCIDRWLVPRHPVLGVQIELPTIATTCARQGDVHKYGQFLDDIEVLLFVEQPFLQGYDLVKQAHQRGIYVVCIPMIEWLPYAGWTLEVDCMWATSKWCMHELTDFADMARRANQTVRWSPCKDGNLLDRAIHGFRWGANLNRFPFQQRIKAERFLFINGRGGVGARKGADIVARAAKLCPEVPLAVFSQVDDLPPFPSHVKVRIGDMPEQTEFYRHGDVLLAPSRWEGLGLQLYEALASGLVVMATDAPPLNELDLVQPLPATPKGTQVGGKSITAYEVAPGALADRMRALHGKDISALSLRGRAMAEERNLLDFVIPYTMDMIVHNAKHATKA